MQALASFAAFRGAGEEGPCLGIWLGVLALSWAVALLYQPLEPALVLVPPLLTIVVLEPPLRELMRRRSERASRSLAGVDVLVAGLLFAAVGIGVFYPQLRRGMQIDTGDNQLMMARAQLLYEGLRQGHWLHWTHLWEAGDTLTDLYPIEANLITAAIHAISPRGTAFETSYTVFVLLSWWLRGVGVYYLARRFASPVVSFVLGYAFLFDVGTDVWGGVWHSVFFWGMVHNALALTFALFATALMVDLTRRVTSARLVACALMVAATVCGHPLGMLAIVITTFALAVAWCAGRGQHRETAWALAASGAGLLLAAVWVVPYSRALSAGNFRVALPGSTFTELGRALLGATSPTSSLAMLTGISLLGAAFAAFSADVGASTAAIASLILVCLTLTPLLVSARIIHYLPAFTDGQPVRMLAAFKTVSVPCLAWLITAARTRLVGGNSLRVAKVIGRVLVLGILLYGPGRALVSGLDVLGADLRDQVKHVGHLARRSHTDDDYDKVVDWLAQRRREDPRPVLWRASVLFRNTLKHALWPEGMRTGVPIVDSNQVPSVFFAIRPREQNPVAYGDWNIRYVLTDYDEAPMPGTVERFAAGHFHVWELEPFDDRYAVAPEAVRIDHLALEGESIRFHVEGAPPEGADIKLRTAAFPRWRARQQGRWLTVSSAPPRPGAKPHQEQLVVHAGNGDVVVTCDGTMPGYWTGLFVTIGAALTIVAGASRRRRDQAERLVERGRAGASMLCDRLQSVGTKRLAAATGAIVVALLAGGLLVRIRGTRELSPPALEGVGPFDVHWYGEDGLEACLPAFWRGQFHCGSGAVVVESFVGARSPGDDSGEFAALWPGIRVTSRRPATVVIDLGRVALTDPAGLWLQTSTINPHRVKIRWGKDELGHADFSGEEIHQFRLPDAASGGRPMSIEIEALRGDSTFNFRGGAGRAPSP